MKEFGNVTRATEDVRKVWTPAWVEAVRDVVSDVRYAIRILTKNPGFFLFLFGAGGMALAALGIYRLVSYAVKQSTRDIGIRMAIGATSGSVLRLFLGRGVGLGAIGATVGFIGALAATRMLGTVLYGVNATDPVSFMRGLGVVLAAIVIATLVPAWRAARTNPLTALRHE